MLDLVDAIANVVLAGTLEQQRKTRAAVAALALLGLMLMRGIDRNTETAFVVIGVHVLVAGAIAAFSVADTIKERHRVKCCRYWPLGLGRSRWPSRRSSDNGRSGIAGTLMADSHTLEKWLWTESDFKLMGSTRGWRAWSRC